MLPRFSHTILIFLASLVISPIVVILINLFTPTGENWQHFIDYLLADYLLNTILLLLLVVSLSAFLGIGSAYLVTHFRFLARGFFNWSLILPLAMPGFILAYSWTSILDRSSILQTEFFAIFGVYLPDIRNLFGAALMLTLTLYPYVYLLARNAFLKQSSSLQEMGEMCGYSPWQIFYKLKIPLARPGIIAGLVLVMMEALADYGTVSYFSIQVLTTAIFKSWFGLGDIGLAAKLSALMLVFVFAMILIEKKSRKRAAYYNFNLSDKGVKPAHTLSGTRAALAIVALGLPVFFGFVLPCLQLVYWSFLSLDSIDFAYFRLLGQSFGVAFMAACMTSLLALAFLFCKRHSQSKFFKSLHLFVNLGYAVPGAVIAVGIMIIFSGLDRAFGIFLFSTFIGLTFAYIIRFHALANNGIEAALSKINSSFDDTASLFGYKPSQYWRKLHLELIKGSLLTAFLLVFIETLKELPASLILRPFNFNTLAVQTYELASDERLADSALYAMSIVLVSLVPVFLVNKLLHKE